MLRLFLWGIKVEYKFCSTVYEPAQFYIEFDSIEELNAAAVIITIHNLSSLYKVIVKNRIDCEPFIRYTIDGCKVEIQPTLGFKGYFSGDLARQIRLLEEKLRRSYESV